MNASSPPAGPQGLSALFQEVRDALARTTFPLALSGSAESRAAAAAAAAQLDDYILPRLADVDAPLLAVVGGSTGAGKSTLVNALVGKPVTRSGAIRPTTRQPILLHHPLDAGWFSSQRVLPSLTRVQSGGGQQRGQNLEQDPGQHAGQNPGQQTPQRLRQQPEAWLATNAGPQPGPRPSRPPRHPVQEAPPGATATLLLRADTSIPVGLAILDAPDVDSIADENRRLAGQLLAA
ncbi:GTPase domain-containing protein, partial [Arthrobacter sp. Br18]|uniref:GTPase domain-containing protein n=1 Tax=Arthrobacter sp. Br18 TaxID=1312954 RepID=UPI00055B3838